MIRDAARDSACNSEPSFSGRRCRDIENQKKTELALQKSEQKLQRMSEFLSNMSHELRTPLTAILSMSEVMQKGLAGPVTEEQLDGFRVIQSSGSHLLELMNEVLDLAKIESGSAELRISKIQIQKLCESSLQLVTQQAKLKDIDLISRIPSSLPLLHADEKRVRQMLVNLLGNAVKFTPESGTVTLEVICLDSTDTNNLLNGCESTVKFSVADTGIGINESELESVFEPFVQIDTMQADASMSPTDGGTGLGLALVKQFAECHGGSVGVSSEIGKGSCFYVELPLRVVNPAPVDLLVGMN